MRGAGLALLAALLLACGDDDEARAPAPEPPSAPEPPAPIVAGRPIATDHAFDLVPTSEGAVLLWGPPHRDGGGLRAVRLGPTGAAVGPEVSVRRGVTAQDHPSHVVEVRGASAGRALGAAWVIDHGRVSEVQAARSPDGGRRFARPRALGATVDHAGGGRVSIVANDEGTMVVHHRIGAAPCTVEEGPCARIARHTLGDGDLAEAVRDTSTEEVPRPCEPLVTGALHRDGSWYYGLCSDDPRPTTVVFVIDVEPSLATPVEVAPGCVPRGFAPLDRGVAALSRCGQGADAAVAAHVLDDRGQTLARWRDVERRVRCERGQPVLTLASGGDERTLRLGAAIDGIEGLLPAEVAPAGARAVWTGEALLVGVPEDHELTVRRYACERGDRLHRTDRP